METMYENQYLHVYFTVFCSSPQSRPALPEVIYPTATLHRGRLMYPGNTCSSQINCLKYPKEVMKTGLPLLLCSSGD